LIGEAAVGDAMDEVTCGYASRFTIVKRRGLYYADLPADHYLVPPPGEVAGLRFRTPLPPRIREFQACHAHDALLLGQRAYVSSDGFFVDESMNPTFSWAAYRHPFGECGRHEEYGARFGEAGVVLNLPAAAEVIEEPLVSLASAEPSNYGSWIFRVIPKLVGWDDWRGRGVLAYQNSAWMGNLLRFCFGEELRVVPHWPHLHYRLRDVVIPAMRNQESYLDQETLEFYRDRAAAVPGHSALERVYLSRTGQAIRPLANEGELIAALAAHGFAIVAPEALALADQVRVVRDARVLVVPGGSGLFNAVFAASAAFVLDIEPGREWLLPHHSLLRSCALPHGILFGERLDDSGPHAPWRVDVAQVIATLRAAGAVA